MIDFIPCNEALELRELGFDEVCFGYYNTTWNKPDELLFPQYAGELENWNNTQHLCSAPTFSQAFRFFRKQYNLEPQVKSWKEKGGIVWHYSIQKIGEPSIFRSSDCAVDSHDEAQLICLQKLIQIVKNEKHSLITN